MKQLGGYDRTGLEDDTGIWNQVKSCNMQSMWHNGMVKACDQWYDQLHIDSFRAFIAMSTALCWEATASNGS